MMQYRFLGGSGLKVSTISLGGWLTIGSTVDEDLAYNCMARAFEQGVNFFDNAETYGEGKSELLFGKVFKRAGWKRSDFVVSTKIFWGGQGPNDCGLSRKHIIEGVDGALERMGLEYVDLVYAHRPDPLTPMEETVRAFNHVICCGKAFYWGTSEWSAQQIMEAHMVAKRLDLIGPLMEQPQYNMFCRDRVEKEYLPLIRDYNLGLTIWSPLAGGILTGKYAHDQPIPENSRFSTNVMRTGREKAVVQSIGDSYFSTESGRRKLSMVTRLQSIAKRIDCSMAQLALAWTLHNPHVSSAIIGATRVTQIDENLAALKVVPKLTETVMKEIENILENRPVPETDFRA